MRASAADFAHWPMDGSLTLDGATPAALTTGCGCSIWISPSTCEASDEVCGTVTLARALGTPRQPWICRLAPVARPPESNPVRRP